MEESFQQLAAIIVDEEAVAGGAFGRGVERVVADVVPRVVGSRVQLAGDTLVVDVHGVIESHCRRVTPSSGKKLHVNCQRAE